MKMTKSESGKLGAIASLAKTAELLQIRLDVYELNPSRCKECDSALPYLGRKNKFCNHSCSARHVNAKRKKIKPVKVDPRIAIKQRIEAGTYSDRFGLKKYILENVQVDRSCLICKLSTWNDLPIPLELDHVDGDASNNILSNLRVICPNCHAQTPTSKGRNRGSGRKSRGLPVN